MAGDYDYPGVATPDDEDEELLKRFGGYPAPAPLNPAATPAPAPPVSAPAPAPAGGASPYPAPMPAPVAGSTEDLEARADQPRRAISDMAAPAPAPPQWKDYVPPEPHGWSKLGHVLAALHPLSNNLVNVNPMRAAEQKYSAATNEFKENQGVGAEQSRQDLESAQAENQRSEANAREHPPGDWKNAAGIIGPNNEPVEINEKTGEYRYGSLTGAKPLRQPGETQEQNKQAFQSVVGKLDAAGLPTDVKSIDKSLDTALKNGTITAQEHASARGYQSANTTPATNLTVHVAGAEEAQQAAIDKMFEGKEVIAHMPDGRRVQMSYADAKSQNIPPERLVALNPKEAQDTRDKAASIQTTFQGLDRYRTDLKKNVDALTEDDRRAMQVLTSHEQVGQGFVAKAAAGALDTLFGEPLTGYSEKAMGGIMTKDQYDKMSPAGRKLISDYFSAIIDNFANMKAIMGSVGRNPMQLQAEINTIPLPYLDWDSANAQFENKRASLQQRAGSTPELYAPPTK